MMVYRLLSALFPLKAEAAIQPRRLVMIRPCCIGDAVMATAALAALRELYPAAHISWAIGAWSARAIAHHPGLDSLLLIEDAPLESPAGLWRLAGQLREGRYDLAVSLSRSPLMSLAVWLAGIPLRAGLDSGGRGFGYNLRVAVDPAAPIHEAEVYLSVVSALAGQPAHAYAELPVLDAARASIRQRLHDARITAPFIVAHPGGGHNPGMRFDGKRYPPAQLAELLNRLADAKAARVILIGGPGDAAALDEVARGLSMPAQRWLDALDFAEIGALAAESLLYIGNDTGLTHLAAASGAKTVMLMGPSDPRLYAPYTAEHLALWKPTALAAGGVNRSGKSAWDWQAQGIGVDEAAARILAFLAA